MSDNRTFAMEGFGFSEDPAKLVYFLELVLSMYNFMVYLVLIMMEIAIICETRSGVHITPIDLGSTMKNCYIKLHDRLGLIWVALFGWIITFFVLLTPTTH